MKAIDEKTGEIIDIGLGCIAGVFLNLDFSNGDPPILTEKAKQYLQKSKPEIKFGELKKNPKV